MWVCWGVRPSWLKLSVLGARILPPSWLKLSVLGARAAPPALLLLATLVATCLLSVDACLLAMAAPVAKFSDTSLHTRFAWTSTCPKTLKVGLAHFRVFLKAMPPQCQVDGTKAVFTDTHAFFSWRRPVTVRAAHMWASRSVKSVNFKGGTGEWILSVAESGPELSQPPAGTPLDETLAPRAMASSSAFAGTSLAVTPPPDAIALRNPAFPVSPSLKMLRGGDLLSETEAGYTLGKELGQGTFGKVYEATCQGRRFAVKRFTAEDARQARLDAMEDATSLRQIASAGPVARREQLMHAQGKPCKGHGSRFRVSDFALAEPLGRQASWGHVFRLTRNVM